MLNYTSFADLKENKNNAAKFKKSFAIKFLIFSLCKQIYLIGFLQKTGLQVCHTAQGTATLDACFLMWMVSLLLTQGHLKDIIFVIKFDQIQSLQSLALKTDKPEIPMVRFYDGLMAM
jgi:hypothetical protein